MNDINAPSGMTVPEEQPKRKRGRPRKPDRLMTRQQWEDESKKAKGRPKGMRTAIKKLEERLLSANRIEGVIDAIVQAAEDPEHKNQAAAWKLIMDRMLPVSYFEKEATGGRSAVSITISSLGGAETTITQEKDVIEGEVISDDV